MSIDTMTGDEFAKLTADEHEDALALYADAVHAASSGLRELEPCTTAHEDCLDKMSRLLTLRRVHQTRLAEMREDEQSHPFNAETDLLP